MNDAQKKAVKGISAGWRVVATLTTPDPDDDPTVRVVLAKSGEHDRHLDVLEDGTLDDLGQVPPGWAPHERPKGRKAVTPNAR